MIKNYPTGKMSPLIHSKKTWRYHLVKGPRVNLLTLPIRKVNWDDMIGGNGILQCYK